MDVPADLLDLRPELPARDVDVPLPLKVHAELADGTVAEVGTTPCPGGVRVPAHVRWWVEPWAPVDSAELAAAVRDHDIAGIRVSCRSQLEAILTAQPRALRLLGVESLASRDLENLVRLPLLDALHVSWPALDDSGLQAVAGCQGLRELSISGACVSDIGLAAVLPALSRLRRLTLERLEQLGGRILDRLVVDQLERLAIRDCPRISEDRLPLLERATRLRSLDLSGTAIRGRCFESLGSLPALGSLDLRRCEFIADEAMRTLADLPTLESLRVASTRLGDTALELIARVPRLSELDVSAPWADRAVAQLASPRLRRLALRVPAAQPFAVAAAVQRSPALVALSLECDLTEPVVEAVTHATTLEALELELTDTHARLRGLRRLSRLRRLRLTGHVTDLDLWALAHAPSSLRCLELDVTRVTCEGFKVLSEMSELRTLRLRADGWRACPCCPQGGWGFRHEQAVVALTAELPDCDIRVVSGQLSSDETAKSGMARL